MYDTYNYLINAYFHQDWREDAKNPIDIIKLFVQSENLANVFALEKEMRILLNKPLDIEFILSNSDYFHPKFFDLSNCEWIRQSLDCLNKSLKNNKVDFATIKNDKIQNAFYQEFTCYYQADELPKDLIQDYFLNKWAKESAVRLSAKIANELLLKILEIMVNQRDFYFNQIINFATDFNITQNDDDWQLFKQVYIKIQEAVINLKGST